MANQDSGNDNTAKSSAPSTRGDMGKVTEKTAAWPGLPGGTGPNRSNGVTKVKTYAKAEGL